MGNESKNKSDTKTRGKITRTKPHDLGNQAFVESQKSVAEEKQTKHFKQCSCSKRRMEF